MQFQLTSEEGLPIHGDFDVPAGKTRALVVIVHGFKGFKDWGFFPWLAERLCNAGLAACRFNMSRSGIGENAETFERLDLFADDTYSGQVADLVQVVRYAQSLHPALPTFLLGHSRGGGIALLAAREIERLRGIVTWSAISRVDRWDEATKRRWRSDGYLEVLNARTRQVMRMSTRILDDYEANAARLDILAAARALTVPLLLLHGARDESVPVEEATLIAAQAQAASLGCLENAGHTYNAIHPLVHVPFALSMAAELSTHFVSAYS
jgi:alpha-beta hydrolase superfamily lysophospholipase